MARARAASVKSAASAAVILDAVHGIGTAAQVAAEAAAKAAAVAEKAANAAQEGASRIAKTIAEHTNDDAQSFGRLGSLMEESRADRAVIHTRITSVEGALHGLESNTNEILSLVRAGKAGAGFIRWVGGVILAIMAVVGTLHLYPSK